MDNQNLYNNPNPAQPTQPYQPMPQAQPMQAQAMPQSMPPVQPIQPAQSPLQPAQPAAPAAQPYTGTGSMVAPATTPNPAEEIPMHRHRKPTTNLYLLIGLIAAGVIACVFIGLFVWMYVQYDDVSTDVQGKVNEATAIAVNENTVKLENEFTEREKEPNKTFSGPSDYGEVSLQYPKTWSVYVEQDASNGGDFKAYFSPGEVFAVRDDTPNALRLTISTQAFDSVVKTYESYVTSGRMTMSVITVNGANANLYKGTLPSQLKGAVCLIKIRDKTVILQTDSELYMSDYNKILESVVYNS